MKDTEEKIFHPLFTPSEKSVSAFAKGVHSERGISFYSTLEKNRKTFRNQKVVGSTPTASFFQASRDNNLGAFSFFGLLQGDKPFAESPLYFKKGHQGSDLKCERFQSTGALNLNSWLFRTASRGVSDSSKREILSKPFPKALRGFLIFGISLSLYLTTSATAFCSITTEPTAVSYSSISIERLADAIRKAEGIHSKHPYGILKKYKKTSPRQACINTIKHALKDWNGNGDFISFLGARYCPVGAANDPTGLNKNWIKNVRFFYERGTK